MIDYKYQHDSHCVDYRMRLFMRAHPALPSIVPTDEQIEWERNWANYQDQLYHRIIQR